MINRFVLLLAAAWAAAAPAAAQQRSHLDAAGLRLEPGTAAATRAPVRLSAARGGSASRTAVHVLGGALLGAGAGYLASQVAWSDWDKSSNSEFAHRRMSFAVGGGAVGALVGAVLGHGSPRTLNAGPAPAVPVNAMGAMITSEDLRAATATTLYELLQSTHPTWLRGRGEGAFRAGKPATGAARGTPAGDADGTGVSALSAQGPADLASSSPAPKVYLDGGFLGDVNQLREVLVAETESVEYLDVAAATYRFGPGHPSGAISVKSRGHR
jgi:hypothetical protein